MAKKVILKDLNNIEVLPITRGELILDSSGNRAFHSNLFLATDSLPGLMSAIDKLNLDNITDKFTTYNVVSTTANGLAPKLINTNTNTVGNAYYVLASTDGSATPSWYKLPANAFANDDTKVTQTDTTTYCDYRVLLSGNDNDTTETTIARKSVKLLFNPNSGRLTAKTFMGEFFTVRSTEITNTWRPYNVMAWFPNINKTNDNYAGDNTGFPVSSNANGILWLGTHPASGGSDSLGYGHLLGFSSNGNIYSRYFHSNVPTTANGGSWKLIAFTTSNITGNAATATKLQNKRKLWGLDFDGTADVNGTITINGNLTNGKSILFPGGEYLDGAGNIVLIGGEPINSWNVMVNTDGTTTSVFKVGETGYGTFKGVVTAPTFKGNLDSTYVNKLTGYVKATAAADLATTDSLNVALGKLEYKADTAYDWIISVTSTDTDKYINKWQEIIDFLNKVDDTDGADITDEFVTRKTNLTITGLKTFLSDSDTTGISLILKNSKWKSNMSTAMDFYNGSAYTVPNARIETKMVGDGRAGGTLIFYTQTKHASTNPNPNGLTERLRIDDNGLTEVTGLLSVTNEIKVSGDITLYTDSGNSPRLIFLRGILTNDAYDWDLYVTGGAFKIRYNPGTNLKELWIDVLSMHPNMITTPWNIGSLGFCKTNSSNAHILLGGGDHKLISDFVLKSELLQSNLTVISKTITVGSDWVDTGIVLNSETFPEGAGSYIVQVARGSTYVWTGVMTVLLSTNVTREGTEEILLHGGGFDMGNDHHTFLRTYGDTTNKIYKLQIARNGDPEEKTFTFKFKRMI